MKILHLNTFYLQGGAARAASRLHQGLIEIGQQSRMLTLHKNSDQETVSQLPLPSGKQSPNYLYLNAIQNNYINLNRSAISNTLFSLPYPGLDVDNLDQVIQADIINLHWLANFFQSPITIKKLLDLGKPVVWTLHDMWAFTGGCHYSAGCQGYQADCSNCPQLSNDLYNLPQAILKDKLELISNPNLVIVTPSKWLADCVQKSHIFARNRLEVIPYSLDSQIFKPLDKFEAKKLLNIDGDCVTILAGAQTGKEKRKGFIELIKVLKICLTYPFFQKLVQTQKFKLICFGEPNEELNNLDLPILSLGTINDDQKLSQIYAAADLFLLPSLEDNFPNTMLEAMSCGTPVIGFKIGGIPDLIQDKITGRIVPPENLDGMAEVIIQSLSNGNELHNMGKACRQVVEENYYLSRQAHQYLELYQQLIDQNELCSPLSSQIEGQANNSDSHLTNHLSERDNLTLEFNTNLGKNLSKIFPHIALSALTKELEQTQASLYSKNLELNNLQQKLHEKEVVLVEKETQLQQTEAQLQRLQETIDDQNLELNKFQQQLPEKQAELERLQQTIIAMKSSKFWKLRTKWFKLKKWLGLQSQPTN
jgi:glycosyltransferase involved in cell wall biosynthesis